jgi:hypothetical protein
MMSKATVRYSNTDGTGLHTFVVRNTSHTANMSLIFDNVSGIVRNGRMSFTGASNGMWIGCGGAALTPTPTIFQGSLQCGGVISPDGAVSYDPSTNTYTGTGDVIEFVGTMPVNGVMRNGWAGAGEYGTPGAGPGSGWMPGWGAGGNTAMPGWGGNVSNWGMMGGYGSVTPNPTPNGGDGGYMGGGGMMGPGGGGMMGVAPGSGTGTGPGMMGQSVSAAVVSGSRAGTMRTWINPTAAAMITVTNGVPDRSNPQPVIMKITLPAMQLRMVP